ncbi:vacuolar sorting protein VPS33/slp1 [Quaeritorhiza haematococci]|nr:vacuolar sorting protein VPS33/slp1 [Quaeritorhiza haematococci]
MTSIKELLKKRILVDMLRQVQPPGRWKVMVVDSYALKILSAACTMPDILDEQVTLVEKLQQQRQPYPQMEAVYFMAPVQESIQIMIDDFKRSRPLYAAAHLYFTSSLPDRLLEKIKLSPVLSKVKSLKELNVDFIAYESKAFLFEQPQSMWAVYNPPSASLQTYELETIAKRLTSVLATLGEYPYIRYYDAPQHKLITSTSVTAETPTAKLAELLQTELDTMCRLDSTYPPKTNHQRAILLILDRSVDMLAPLLHEFSYEAMMTDMLPLEDGKYRYESADGSNLIQFDEREDQVWTKTRHWHIADVMEHLAEEVKKFATDNKAAQYELDKDGRNGSSMDKLQQMKETMASLPQYQELKKKYAIHTNVCQDCMEEYNARKLEKVATIEQNIATGETADGRPPKFVLMDVLPLLDDPNISHDDKVRLVMLYIVSQPNGIPDDDRQKLIDRANLTLEERQAVHNLSMLGIRLGASLDSRRRNENKNPYSYVSRFGSESKKKRAEEVRFENSRYIPGLKFLLEDQARDVVDGKLFPWLRPPPEHAAAAARNGAGPVRRNSNESTSSTASSPALRTTKPSWATRKATTAASVTSTSSGASSHSRDGSGRRGGEPEDLRVNGPRIILFMLGGMTFSEMRVCHEIIKETQREVMIDVPPKAPRTYLAKAKKAAAALPPPSSTERSSRANGHAPSSHSRRPLGASSSVREHRSDKDSSRDRREPMPRAATTGGSSWASGGAGDPRRERGSSRNRVVGGDDRYARREGSESSGRADPRSERRGSPPRGGDPRYGLRDPRDMKGGDTRDMRGRDPRDMRGGDPRDMRRGDPRDVRGGDPRDLRGDPRDHGYSSRGGGGDGRGGYGGGRDYDYPREQQYSRPPPPDDRYGSSGGGYKDVNRIPSGGRDVGGMAGFESGMAGMQVSGGGEPEKKPEKEKKKWGLFKRS